MEFKVEMRVFHDGKMIPSAVYRQQKLLSLLSEDAKTSLAWLKARNKHAISLVELTKCIMPAELRKAGRLRRVFDELMHLGLAKAGNGVIYSGRQRKEVYLVDEFLL